MAFRRFDRCHDAVGKFHSVRKTIEVHALADEIWNVYDWLLSPFSLWPIDFVGLAHHLTERLRTKRAFDADLVLLLQILDSPPTEFTQTEIGAYEQKVQAGQYDSLVKQPQKFQEQEAKLQCDGELIGYWNKLKERFRTTKFEVNKLHIIRRSMSQERNFRPNLRFSWHRRKDKFDQLFDALCYRWYLYGFEGDKPLLLKISVNPIPHGTMIVIPRHWSFDKARDLDWAAISKLHRAHGAARQGPKLSNSRIERLSEVAQAEHYNAEAARLGLRGAKKWAFMCEKMRKDIQSDPSWLKRLLKPAL